MKRASTLLLALAPLLVPLHGCDRVGEPRAQWVVHVGTDALLPGLGNRVRVDVVDEEGNACAECVRVFDVDSATMPISFGVLPGEGRRFVRARLFRAEAISAFGEPTSPLLDVIGELPPLSAEIVDVEVVLTMDCFGRATDPVTKLTCDPGTSEDTTDLVFAVGTGEGLPPPGSWRFGEEPCPPDPPSGMVCVPGGTFLLGSRAFRPFGPEFDPVPEQLVHVSPFYLDTDEVTVATYRTVLGGAVGPPRENSITDPYCAFTPEPGDSEAAGVNCMTRASAEAACLALGKRLPTEAEWEFAAGGAGLEAPFPWNISEPTSEDLCVHAVVARDELGGPGSRECVIIEPDIPSGPQIGGSELDVSYLGGRNMAGNLAEWVADDFAFYSDEVCWGTDLELRDNPQCVADSTDGIIRGGDWTSLTYNTHTFIRRPAPRTIEHPSIGFRCAKSAE